MSLNKRRKKSNKKKHRIAICGIYSITNKINGKKYIGQSIDIKKRWNRHKSPSTWRELPNIVLYKAFVKYGISNFTFKIEEVIEEYDVEVCDKKDIVELNAETLNELEIQYIEKYDTYKNGYNMTRGNLFAGCYRLPLYYYTKEYRPNLIECWIDDKYSLYDEEKGIIFTDVYDLADETWNEKSLAEIINEVDNYIYYVDMPMKCYGSNSTLSAMEQYEQWAIANDPYYK